MTSHAFKDSYSSLCCVRATAAMAFVATLVCWSSPAAAAARTRTFDLVISGFYDPSQISQGGRILWEP